MGWTLKCGGIEIEGVDEDSNAIDWRTFTLASLISHNQQYMSIFLYISLLPTHRAEFLSNRSTTVVVFSA